MLNTVIIMIITAIDYGVTDTLAYRLFLHEQVDGGEVVPRFLGDDL